MKCPGDMDWETGKQVTPDYCIPEKNGDWYVIIFHCLLKKIMPLNEIT